MMRPVSLCHSIPFRQHRTIVAMVQRNLPMGRDVQGRNTSSTSASSDHGASGLTRIDPLRAA